MGRTGFEAYQHYERFLRQGTVWPSESNGETVLIAEMVPRYAASAHAKLLRWSSTMAAQAQLNIYNVIDRVTYVRGTPLAVALARAAQSLPPAASETEVAEAEVTPRDMILAFAPVLAEHTELDITAIFKVCEALATKADEQWTVTLQPR